MNKHIELVKKWLDNPGAVSMEELESNARNARAAFPAVAAALAADEASNETADYYAAVADAAYWVNKYEELAQKE
jgi:hypothetical protein